MLCNRDVEDILSFIYQYPTIQTILAKRPESSKEDDYFITTTDQHESWSCILTTNILVWLFTGKDSYYRNPTYTREQLVNVNLLNIIHRGPFVIAIILSEHEFTLLCPDGKTVYFMDFFFRGK